MDIQFNHFRNLGYKGGVTTAILLPNKEEFISLLQNPERTIELQIGVSYCSHKDQYCKKTGREIALTRLVPTLFKLGAMYFHSNGDVLFTLYSKEDKKDIETIEIKASEKSDRLHFLKAE